MEHAGSLEALGTQLEKFISTKTVFGEPVIAGKVTLIPIQTVSFGFASGGGQGTTEKDAGGGSGSGGGASLRPMAIVAVKDDGDVQVYTFEGRGIMDKVVEKLPEVVSKINLVKFKKDKDKAKEECKEGPREDGSTGVGEPKED
ncbi:MAG TPA: sporulation protein [Firmicutes bacterium]|jgi:uncharacterized spore protein YtfJ|nr:sporulation protein [Bacillota bacterium]